MRLPAAVSRDVAVPVIGSQEKHVASPSESSSPVPRHVAIIMDGNGRWARRRMLPRLEGHRQGAKAVRRAVEFCRRAGIGFLTLYAFSTENWQRPRKEVSGLMKLLSDYIESELEELHANGIRLNTIGDMSRLPAAVAAKVQAAKSRTRDNRAMTLTIAVSYGGRQEIVNAALRVARELQDGELKDDQVTVDTFAEFLDTRGMPDPDLLIRTGGEERVSNFLLWQLAYTELYFTPLLWPDFDDAAFTEALEAFRGRQRRFGRTSEQIQTGEGGS